MVFSKEKISSFYNVTKIPKLSVNLQLKVLIIYLCITVLVFVFIGVVLPTSLYKQNLNTVSKDIINQMKHIDFALYNFIEEKKCDVLELSINKDVRSFNDKNFTSFLNASEKTFKYSIGDQEQKIINIFNDYQLTHPHVNSVYMGRENGTFVRSNKRASATAYDPRNRPWYILAKEHPGQVMVTEPYQSVTTTDVNIGVVIALLDQKNSVFGVVGADITLENLTKYISGIDIGRDKKMILTDKNGIILAAKDSAFLFSNINNILQSNFQTFLNSNQGILDLNGTYLIYYTSPELGWKIGVFLPFNAIKQEITKSIQRILFYVIIALIMLSVITIILLNRTIIRPLSSLTEMSKKIAETGDANQQIEAKGGGEIGILAHSFKAMVEKISTEAQGRKQALLELADHRDNLEKLVNKRTLRLHETNKKLSNEIKERINIEKVLIDSEAKYRDLVENVNSIILRWTKDGNITFINKYAQSFFGYSEKEIIGKNIMNTIVPEIESSGRDISTLIKDVFTNPEANAFNENENIKKNGDRAWISWTNRPITDKQGEVIEILSVGNDITDRKTAEDRLKHILEELTEAKEKAESADRLKSVFLATMSHELRTPLNSIIGFTGILLQGLAGELNKEQKKQLGMVQKSANHLLSLINDVLDLSKIEAGQLTIQEKPFDIISSIKKVISIVMPLALKKGLKISTDFNIEICEFIGDERRLEQILINLLNNSIKFTEKGEITIICKVDSNNIIIAVKDTGIGISSENKIMLFKPFLQLDSSTLKKYEGTGLGLSITKKLVEMMKGEIFAESEIDKGSTFTVIFKNNIGEKK